MGLSYPINASQDGDNEALAPTTLSRTLLGAERGTQNSRRLEVDSNRNLYVSIAADSTKTNVSSLAYDEVANVVANSETTVVTYTAATDLIITRISISGDVYAKVKVYINSSTIETKRMGADRNVDFVWADGMVVNNGDIIDVKVIHFATGTTPNYEASIYGK